MLVAMGFLWSTILMQQDQFRQHLHPEIVVYSVPYAKASLGISYDWVKNEQYPDA